MKRNCFWLIGTRLSAREDSDLKSVRADIPTVFVCVGNVRNRRWHIAALLRHAQAPTAPTLHANQPSSQTANGDQEWIIHLTFTYGVQSRAFHFGKLLPQFYGRHAFPPSPVVPDD